MTLISNSKLALPQGIPKLHGLVTRAGDNLTVVHRESHREDILGVPDKTTSGLPSLDLPQAQSPIPRPRQRKLAIRGDDHIRDKVSMAAEGTLGVAIVLPTGQVPDHHSLVAGRREEQIGVVGVGGQGSDPPSVALELRTEVELFTHGCWW